MRIGLFTDTYLPVINGVVTSVVTLREGLIQQGHDVFVISNHGSLVEISYKDNILLLPGIPIKFLFENNLSGPFQARGFEIVKSMNLDIVHIHSEFGIGHFGQLCARRLKIPMIYTYHTTWEDYTHYVNPWHIKSIERLAKKMVAKFSKFFARSTKAVVVPSIKTKQLLSKYGIQQPIHVIPTGLNLQKFERNPQSLQQANQIRQQYQVGEQDMLFVFVGRLGQEKNLSILVEAFSKIKNDRIKLMIVGKGPIEEELKQTVLKQNLGHKVFLTGAVANDQIARYYLAANAFVSAAMTETQGLTFIEAMASGCVIFAKDKEVVSEICLEQETGFYFDDVDSLIAKIMQYVQLSTEQKEQMRLKALLKVQPYKKEVFVERLSKLYSEVLDGLQRTYEIVFCKVAFPYINVMLNNGIDAVNMFFEPEMIDHFNLRENNLVDEKLLSILREKNLVKKYYQLAIKKLEKRDYSVYQMMQLLKENGCESKVLIDEVILQLQQDNYLNDNRFVSEIVQVARDKGYGIVRILKELEKYHFSQDLITLTQIELESKQVDDLDQKIKELKEIKVSGSKVQAYQKIKERLMRLGYTTSQIQQQAPLEQFEYDETDSCMKDCLSLQHRGFDQLKTRQKLYQKGYSMEVISNVIEEVFYED